MSADPASAAGIRPAVAGATGPGEAALSSASPRACLSGAASGAGQTSRACGAGLSAGGASAAGVRTALACTTARRSTLSAAAPCAT